jgi:hypothetical protein
LLPSETLFENTQFATANMLLVLTSAAPPYLLLPLMNLMLFTIDVTLDSIRNSRA